MTFFDRFGKTSGNRIVFSIQHPAHVHLFRNAIKDLEAFGFDVSVFARKKDINIDLLEHYDIPHTVLAGEANSILELCVVEATYEYRLAKAAREIRPSVMVAMGGVGISRPSLVSGAKSLVLTDTEHAKLQNLLAFPFADRILTPDCYKDEIGPKQIRYPGYHELAYLHPNRFEPDESVLDEIDADRSDSLVILRLVSWDAVHDVGDTGFNDIEDVVSKLEETGVRVLITSEAPLPEAVEHCRVSIEPHRIHHLMYYADLYLGESATMATESAVLGTPAVFVSSIKLGYTTELEERYELVSNFHGRNRQADGLERALSILEEYDESAWKHRRDRLLAEKIDTTEFIVSQVTELGS